MKEIFRDEYIILTETEKDYGFIATIENESEELIRFETNGEDLFSIEPKTWVGLLANYEDRKIFDILKRKKYCRHICEQSISYELDENCFFED